MNSFLKILNEILKESLRYIQVPFLSVFAMGLLKVEHHSILPMLLFACAYISKDSSRLVGRGIRNIHSAVFLKNACVSSILLKLHGLNIFHQVIPPILDRLSNTSGVINPLPVLLCKCFSWICF